MSYLFLDHSPSDSQLEQPGRVHISDRLERALKEWEGTPFVPYMSQKGVGCDCLRFAHAVYEEIGLAKPIEWPSYGMQSADRQELDRLFSVIEGAVAVSSETLNPEPGTVPTPIDGDMLVFSSGRAIHHTGIYFKNRIWHCDPRRGVMASQWEDTSFTRHIKRIFRATI